jgi:hypothetical protein
LPSYNNAKLKLSIEDELEERKKKSNQGKVVSLQIVLLDNPGPDAIIHVPLMATVADYYKSKNARAAPPFPLLHCI